MKNNLESLKTARAQAFHMAEILEHLAKQLDIEAQKDASNPLEKRANDLRDKARSLNDIEAQKDASNLLVKLASVLRDKARSLKEGRFKILFAGEFSRGKSTILNAIAGENILPAKQTPCTGMITMISNGTPSGVTVHYEDGRPHKELTVKEFCEEYELKTKDQGVDQDRFSGIDRAEIKYPIDWLGEGVELIDSPGLKDEPLRTMRTVNYLEKVDAVVMVLSAAQPFTEDEMKFIRDELHPRRLRNLFFLVNYWDFLESPLKLDEEIERDRRELEDRISTILVPMCIDDGVDKSKTRIFRTSALAALSARRNKARDDEHQRQLEKQLANSDIPAFEACLGDFLTNDIATAQRRVALGVAESVLEKFRAYCADQLVFSGRSLEELERERSAVEPKLGWLRDIRKDTENFLDSKSEVLRTRLVTSLIAHMEKAHEKLVKEERFNLSFLDDRWLTFESIWGKVRERFGYANKLAAEIERELKPQIEKYINDAIEDWKKNYAPQVINTVQDDITDKLLVEAKRFSELIAEIKKLLHLETENANSEERILGWVGYSTHSGFMASHASVSAAEVVGNIFGPVLAAIVADVALHLSGHLVPIIGTILSLIFLWRRENRMRDQIREGIRATTSKAMSKVEGDLRETMQKKVKENFDRIRNNIGEQMALEMAEVTAGLDVIIKKKRKVLENYAKLEENLNSSLRALEADIVKLREIAG